LHPNAEQNERNDTQNAMRSRRRNDLGDLWSIRIAEIDEHTKNDYSNNHPIVRLIVCLNDSS
jgi:hypothetical protein